jgi:hypothetical protein
MNELLSLWLFVIVNMLVFLFGCLITGLSYLAYHSSERNPSFKTTTLGFGLITIGCIVEPVYQFGIKRDFNVSSLELLQLQALEGTFIALGLILLFSSIYRYSTASFDENRSYRVSADELIEKNSNTPRTDSQD